MGMMMKMVVEHSHRYLYRAPQLCPNCHRENTIKHGKSAGKKDKQKWFCHDCKGFFKTEVRN